MSSLLRSVPHLSTNSGDETRAIVSSSPALTVPSLSGWRKPGILIGALFAAILLLFWQTAESIGKTWYSSRTFSHGFLIVPMALYLIWVRRQRVAWMRPKPNYWGLPLLLVLSGVWLLAASGDIRIVQQFALVGILFVLVWTVFGTSVVRALWFPLAFLFFAVPFGESIIGPLQDFTAHFAVAALGLSRVPAILENRTIWVPSGPWVIAEACSGIRYLISSIVLGLVYASLVYRSRRRRALFILASIAVPILANGLRAYGIILLGYLTDNRLAAGVDHIIYGWIFFTAVQLVLFTVGLRWRESPGTEAVDGQRDNTTSVSIGKSLGKIIIASILALVVVGLGPLAEAVLAHRVAAGPVMQFLPVVTDPWRPVANLGSTWAPRLHPSSELSRSYISDDGRVDLHLASYSGGQKPEMVSGYNRISDANLWSEVSSGYRTVNIGGQIAKVRWDSIQSGSDSRLVWTWYCVQGKFTAKETTVKAIQAKARLFGQPATIAVISLSTGYILDQSEAASRMQHFLNHTSLELTPVTTR
jgi:exosortase A